jgi:hypothetical protein
MNFMPFGQLNSFLKILIEVQYKSARAVSERFFGTEEWAEKIWSQPQTIYSEVP